MMPSPPPDFVSSAARENASLRKVEKYRPHEFAMPPNRANLQTAVMYEMKKGIMASAKRVAATNPGYSG